MGLACSRVEVCVGLRPRGGEELNSTGLGEAPGSHRSFTSSSLEALLSSPCRCHLHPPSAPAVLAIPAIRSSSSSELWRSMAGSSSNRTRRTRPGESRPWLGCWLVASGVRTQFLRRSEGQNKLRLLWFVLSAWTNFTVHTAMTHMLSFMGVFFAFACFLIIYQFSNQLVQGQFNWGHDTTFE